MSSTHRCCEVEGRQLMVGPSLIPWPGPSPTRFDFGLDLLPPQSFQLQQPIIYVCKYIVWMQTRMRHAANCFLVFITIRCSTRFPSIPDEGPGARDAAQRVSCNLPVGHVAQATRTAGHKHLAVVVVVVVVGGGEGGGGGGGGCSDAHLGYSSVVIGITPSITQLCNGH